MAFLGGIPTIITACFFLAGIFVLTKNKGISIKKMRVLKLSAKMANKNYYEIKELLKTAKPLVKFRFRLLVGAKRYRDYLYQP